ncbi:alpha/beta hydrolase family protein [Colwelliaceae bacterium BS250]
MFKQNNGSAYKLILLATSVLMFACSDKVDVVSGTPSQQDEQQISDIAKVSHLPGSTLMLNSLAELTVESLRSREYKSAITIEQTLHTLDTTNDYTKHYFDNENRYNSYLSSYDSDGLTLYARLDIPASPMPTKGYPVVVFIHGWIGINNAPTYDFNYQANSNYADVIDGYVKQGFVVVTPGLRGHGSVNGIAADGIEYMQAWDNASYLSPMFYTIDTLNLIEGLTSLQSIDWQAFNPKQNAIILNTENINITGHSQGGDVVLTALAISGEDSTVTNHIRTGAIWAGCFLPRFEQAMLYGPMGNSSEAFLSGDGTWTKSAYGANGEFNANFKFAYPADWIQFPDNSKQQWTWQHENWPKASVKESLMARFTTMYEKLNTQVGDVNAVKFSVTEADNGLVMFEHDPQIKAMYANIGGFEQVKYLTEPLYLHHSDRDYYSPSYWNKTLADNINASGGKAKNFEYIGNTHNLGTSKYQWFSPQGSVAGFNQMMATNIELFTH